MRCVFTNQDIIFISNYKTHKIMTSPRYKNITITEDQLPFPNAVNNYKCAGFKKYKQFDLREQLDYCFTEPKTPIQYATALNFPVNNNTHLLELFSTQENIDSIINEQSDTEPTGKCTATDSDVHC